MAVDKKSIKKAKARAVDNAKRNAIPKKIGKTSDDVVKSKIKGKTPDRREIRRNTSGQIISYDIPKSGAARPSTDVVVKNDNGKVYNYGTIKLAGVRNEYIKQEYFKAIDNDIEQFTRDVSTNKTAEINKLNAVSFAPIEGIITEDSVSNLKFTGEIVRVGSSNTSFFYIEEGLFYTINGNDTLWFLAEKLKVPIGFRINDEYDYGGKYKTALGEQLDYGQNQYALYDVESYNRQSIAYVESNEYGGDIGKRKVLGDIADDVVMITYYVDRELVGVKDGKEDTFQQIHVIGDEATKVSYVHFLSKDKFVEARKQIATTLTEDLKINTIQKRGTHDLTARLDIEIHYWGQNKPTLIRVEPETTTTDSQSKNALVQRTYTITGDNITPRLRKIDLKYFDGYTPFGAAGTDGQYRWKNITVSTTSTGATSPFGRTSIGRTTKTIRRSSRGRKIICNELYRQGYLSEKMWDADERYGDMMFESDPKLVIGYQMWARSVVKFMRENPQNTKLAYKLFKPWTEYMGYKMGVVEKPTLMGRLTNWLGTQFSYMVFDLYGGKRLLDKYNQVKVEK